jgi:hypothetical protein
MPPYVFIRQELKVRGKKIVRKSRSDSQHGKAEAGKDMTQIANGTMWILGKNKGAA